ncbi:MAG TPA: hypothetical protein VIK14_12285, partial [Ignavibacteria bacterium]
KGTINNLKIITSSIDNKSSSIERQLYITDKKVSVFGEKNVSLNQKIFESERPIINLYSAKITSDEINKDKHIDFSFFNLGKRAATNVFGKMYGMMDTTIKYLGTLNISRSDNFPSNKGFTFHEPLNFNPDSTSLKTPIYYYFKLTYSDLISGISYNYDIASKLNPFKRGNYLPELTMCPNWEIAKMKRTIERK